jgi:hypothetical protein
MKNGVAIVQKLLLALAVLMFSNSCVGAAQLIWKTETELGKAQQLPSCNPDTDKDCPDYVPYVSRSKFGIKVFETYHEGVRLTFSFNSNEEDGFTVSTDQVHPGGYDWGGVVKKGKFKPLYMIKRFYVFDATGAVNKGQTELTVLRILAGGKSCGVDMGSKIVSDNATARRFAERDYVGPGCSKN